MASYRTRPRAAWRARGIPCRARAVRVLVRRWREHANVRHELRHRRRWHRGEGHRACDPRPAPPRRADCNNSADRHRTSNRDPLTDDPPARADTDAAGWPEANTEGSADADDR